MEPELLEGDRLLAVRLPRRWPLRVGDVVVATDPREPARLMVKRVARVEKGLVHLHGDNAAHSTDSRTWGPVGRHGVWGRVWWRYAPTPRVGRVG